MKIKERFFLVIFFISIILVSLANPVSGKTAQEHLDQGKIYFKQGLYDEAIIETEKALSLDASYGYICNYYLGICYHHKKNFSKAADHFKEAMKYTDDINELAELHRYAGFAILHTKKPEEAISELKFASDLNPEYIYDFFFCTGLYFKKQGE